MERDGCVYTGAQGGHLHDQEATPVINARRPLSKKNSMVEFFTKVF